MSSLHDRFLKMTEEPESFDVSDVNGKVLIVDGLNSYIRCFAAVPTMNEDGDHSEALLAFVTSTPVFVATFCLLPLLPWLLRNNVSVFLQVAATVKTCAA